MGLLTFMAGD